MQNRFLNIVSVEIAEIHEKKKLDYSVLKRNGKRESGASHRLREKKMHHSRIRNITLHRTPLTTLC